MNKIKPEIIKEIAQDLDSGSDCYYNFKTEEVISIPKFDAMWDEDDFKDAFGSDLKKIKKQKANLIKIDVLDSSESFEIMELFVEQLNDKTFKQDLEAVLQNKKPFRHFKYAVDHSDYRQDWFDLKKLELEKIVEFRLNNK